MRFFYNVFVYLYKFTVRAAAFFGNEKAGKWLKGRKNVLKDLSAAITGADEIVWFHCASLGEFEQGRPLIETFRRFYPHYKILLTFFSPSAYEVQKDYPNASYVFYLPADTKRNARKFIHIVRPRMVFFIKYEFWFNYMNELYKQKIPYFFVSVIFRHSQYFFKPWGSWPRRQLQKITYLFVQDERSLELLDRFRLYHAEKIGDTRFDRVAELLEIKNDFPVMKKFTQNSFVMIAGSTWPADEDKLAGLLRQKNMDLKLVIAPHQVGKDQINQLKKKFDKFGVVVYSEFSPEQSNKTQVLIIDSIGLLSFLYRYATIVYVGGGFGAGIHNLLEAATYGKPVIFGPNYKKFKEANDLIENGGGFVVNNTSELVALSRKFMTDEEYLHKSSAIARMYVKEHTGATQKVMEKAKEYLMP